MEDAPDWDDLMEDAAAMPEEEEMPPFMEEDEDDHPDNDEANEEEDEEQRMMLEILMEEQGKQHTAPPPQLEEVATASSAFHADNNSTSNNDEDEKAPQAPPLAHATKRKKDAFAFERYTSHTVWRSETVDSPQRAVLKATEWKRKPLHDDDARGRHPSSHANVAPEVHLVVHHQAQAVTTRQRLAVPRYQVPRRRQQQLLQEQLPSPRQQSQSPAATTPLVATLTASDGQQVAWGRHINSTSSRISNNTTNCNATPNKALFATDTSLHDVFARVQAQRRTRLASAQATVLRRHDQRQHDSPSRQPQQQLWVDAHAPRSFAHLLSDDRTNRLVLQALRAWDAHVFGRRRSAPTKSSATAGTTPSTTSPAHEDNRPPVNRRVILLSGPPGVGKTTLAHICAAHAGYRPLEINGSDDRSKDVLLDRVRRAMESTSVLDTFLTHSSSSSSSKRPTAPRPNCLILDEIDGADSAAVQALVDLVTADPPSTSSRGGGPTTAYLRRPLILICNNPYAPALRSLRPYARTWTVAPPTPTKLVARLRAVLHAQGRLTCESSALHELVAAGGGDIRYCLFALQLAASRDGPRYGPTDLTAAVMQSLRGGSGRKDTTSDVLSVLTSVFQKKAKRGRAASSSSSVAAAAAAGDYIQSMVTSYGDNSKLLDLLFLNAIKVSFIDPTFDRCATLYEWLSQSDTLRSTTSVSAMTNSSLHHALQNLYIPATARVLHWLCRVEQRQELTFTDRQMAEARYEKEANQALAFRLAEGMAPACRSARTASRLGVETASYVLWVLSAGYGRAALDRAVPTVQLLKEEEQQAVTHHADILRSLGLAYQAHQAYSMDGATVAVEDGEDESKDSGGFRTLRLEPPLQRLARYTHGYRARRRPIPDMLKGLLTQVARQVRPVVHHDHMDAIPSPRGVPSPSSSLLGQKRKKEASPTSVVSAKTGSPVGDRSGSSSPTKKVKTTTPSMTNFLGMGARKAKAARRARQLARVGGTATSSSTSSRSSKLAHTGSGVPLSDVMRLKYTKGFTQAVRVPCKWEDLA